MSVKVKVSREVAEAIEWVKKNSTFEQAMSIQLEKIWVDKKIVALNKLNAETFAKAFLDGYEIEQTPEEKLLEYYKEILEEQNASEFGTNDYIDASIKIRVLKTTLNILEHKIDGINK